MLISCLSFAGPQISASLTEEEREKLSHIYITPFLAPSDIYALSRTSRKFSYLPRGGLDTTASEMHMLLQAVFSPEAHARADHLRRSDAIYLDDENKTKSQGKTQEERADNALALIKLLVDAKAEQEQTGEGCSIQ